MSLPPPLAPLAPELPDLHTLNDTELVRVRDAGVVADQILRDRKLKLAVQRAPEEE